MYATLLRNLWPSVRSCRIAISLLLLLACVLVGPAAGQCQPMQYVGGWLYGEMTGVAVDGDLVFYAGGRNVLVADTSSGDGAESLAVLDLETYPLLMLLEGSTLAVSCRSESWVPELVLIDVSVPAQPRVVRRMEMTGIATDLAAADQGGLLLVAQRDRRLAVVDIADPGQAQVVTVITLDEYPFHLDVEGDLAAVDLTGGVVQFIDLTDPAGPANLGTTDFGRSITDLILREGQLLAVAYDGSLLVYDVADPLDWVLVAEYGTAEQLVQIHETHDVLMVGTYSQGLKVLTFEESGDPSFRAILPGRPDIWGQLALGARRIAFTHPLDGLFIYDATDLQDVLALARIPMENAAGDVCLADGVAFTGAQEGGVMALDVSDPSAVRKLGVLAYDAVVKDLVLQGDRLYVCLDDLGLMILDVGDPAAMVELGRLPLGEGVRNLDVADGLAYLMQFPVGLHIIDVSNPASPAMLNTYPVTGGSVAAEGRTVVMLNGGLLVFDMSDPMAPSLVGPVGLDGVERDVDLRDGHAYVAADQAGIAVVDLRDPAVPAVTGYHSTDGPARTVLAEEGFLFSCNTGGRLRVFSTADPAQPVKIGCLDDGDVFGPMAADGDLLLHLPGYELKIYRTDGVVALEDGADEAVPAPAGRGLEAFPNPFNPVTVIAFELAVPGRVDLSVHDVLGRRLRTLVAGPLEAGRHEVPWGGLGARGERVASGVYFVRLRTEAGAETRKILLAK